jgi:hypothetical protein
MVDAKAMIERSIDRWNERDRGGWLALFDPEPFEFEGPEGVRVAGPQAVELVWSTWIDAFPDNKVGLVGAHGEQDIATHQGVFEGTHTGPLVGPAGTIEATGRSVTLPFVMIYRTNGESITGMRLYFDQMELLTQLGVIG